MHHTVPSIKGHLTDGNPQVRHVFSK